MRVKTAWRVKIRNFSHIFWSLWLLIKNRPIWAIFWVPPRSCLRSKLSKAVSLDISIRMLKSITRRSQSPKFFMYIFMWESPPGQYQPYIKTFCLFVQKCLLEISDCCLFSSDCPALRLQHSSDWKRQACLLERLSLVH